MFILFALLFVPLTNQLDFYLGKAQSACHFNQSSLYFNYTAATYNPPLFDLETELIIIEDINFCTPATQSFEKEVIKNKLSKVSMMVPRGNCTFIQKTLNAQQLGVDLLIVYDNLYPGNMVQMSGSSEKTLILINSIFISGIDAAKIKAQHKTCYLSKIKISNKTQIPKQNRELSSIQLPEVFFDLNDVRGMEYLSEFYRNQFYQAFISNMKLNHKLVFTSENCNKSECVLQKDCLLSNPLGNNSLCYKPPTEQHSGKRIIKEQIRSLAILQVLGQKMWFLYRQLFKNNMCHYDELIQSCINKTLKELEVTQKDLYRIDLKMGNIQTSTYLQTLMQNGSIIKIEPKYESVYISEIPSLFLRLCSTMHRPPAQCDIFKQLPQQIKVNDNKAAYYDFKYTSSKLLFIQISQNILDSLEELTIILTNKPNLFNSVSNVDFISVSSTYPIPTIKGRFGFMSNITQQNLQFASKVDGLRNGYLLMKRKQVVNNNFTLLLTLGSSERYKLMIWAQPRKFILRNNVEIATVVEIKQAKNFIVQYVYEDNQEQQYLLTIQSKLGYYVSQMISVFRYQNESMGTTNILSKYNLYFLKKLSDNQDIIYIHSKKTQLDSFKKYLGNCQTSKNQLLVPIVSCKFVLNIRVNYDIGSLLKVSLMKIEPRTIKPLNSILKTTISPQSSYVQRIKLDSKTLPFQLNDFKIIATTNYSLKFSHQYRLLKQNSLDFTDLQEWNRQYLSRTQILYHQEKTNKVNYTSSTMIMKHPYNALKQHLKIANITIFLIYKINPTLTQYLTIVQGLKLTKSAVGETIFTPNSYSEYLTNQRFISSVPYSFAADDGVARKSKSNVLLQIPIKNQNIRVFVRTFTVASVNLTKSGEIIREISSSKIYRFFTPKYFDNFTHFIHGYSDPQHHKHPKYFQFVQHTYLSMRQMFPEIKDLYYQYQNSINLNGMKYITVYEVNVEMIDRSMPIQNKKIYTFGNALSNQYFDPNKNLSNSMTSLTLSNPLVSYDNYFRIVSNKMIRVLNVESIFSQLTNKIQICTYKEQTYQLKNELIQCFNYSQYNQKYWKDLESGIIYSGLKLIGSAVRVKIEIPPENLASSLSSNESYHQIYQKYQQNLDFYIKIKFNDFDKMVQVYYPSNSTTQQLVKGNDEQIINQYKNSPKQNSSSSPKEEPKSQNTTKQVEPKKQDTTKQNNSKQEQDQAIQKQKDELSKQAEDLRKEKKEFQELRSQTIKQKEEIKKQRQDLIKQKDDIVKQKEEITKQKLGLIKQQEEVLKQKEQISKQKQNLMKQNQESVKIKQEASKSKQQASKQKQEMLKQKEQLSTAKLEMAKKQQSLLKQVQDSQTKQLQLQTQKDQVAKQKSQLTKIAEQNRKTRQEIEKVSQQLKQKKGSVVDNSKQIDGSDKKRPQTIIVDDSQAKDVPSIQTNGSSEPKDTQTLYKIIGILMVLILILVCFIIVTVKKLHKLLQSRLEAPSQQNAPREQQSSNKISKGEPF